MSLNIGDLAVVTGPVRLASGSTSVYLDHGDVVEVVGGPDREGDAFVRRTSDGLSQYIEAASLTPLSEIQDDPEIEWGETPYVTLVGVHDYVYEGDEE